MISVGVICGYIVHIRKSNVFPSICPRHLLWTKPWVVEKTWYAKLKYPLKEIIVKSAVHYYYYYYFYYYDDFGCSSELLSESVLVKYFVPVFLVKYFDRQF
jgi:hypothetical protein